MVSKSKKESPGSVVPKRKSRSRRPPGAASAKPEPAQTVDPASEEPTQGSTAAGADASAQRAEWANLPSGVREVLALFEERSSELTFPGVDQEILSALVTQVSEAAERASAVRRAYEEAQNEHLELESSLSELALTGFSYAQIYALRDAAMGERLANFELNSPQKTRSKRRRKPASHRERGHNPSLPFERSIEPATNAAELPPKDSATAAPVETEVILDEEALAARHVA